MTDTHPRAWQIGVISDTHGLLRPQARELLQGVDLIVHAGDIGKPEIVPELEGLAPLRIIRGNIDNGVWASGYPETDAFEYAGRFFYVLHDLNTLDLDPAAAGFNVVISGHSHRPSIERVGPVLFVNPGSAGPRRFSLPTTLAILSLHDATVEAELCVLNVA